MEKIRRRCGRRRRRPEWEPPRRRECLRGGRKRGWGGIGSIRGVVVEIALNIDDGGALVAAAGGQIAQGADEIREAAGGGALGDHVAHKGSLGVLLADLLGDGLLQRLAAEVGKVLVGQILQLQLVGGALQTGGVAGGHHGVGQLPDLACGVFEGAVAVDHGLDVLAGALRERGTQRLGHGHGVAGEELYPLLVRLVGAKEAVLGVIAAAVYGGGEQVIQTQHAFGTGGTQLGLGAPAGVDVAAEDGVGIVQNGLHTVGEDDLRLSAGGFDEALIIVHIINAGEGVDHGTEVAAELRQRQNVTIGVYAGLVQLLHADQMIAHLVGGQAEKQNHLFGTGGDAGEQQGEAVAAEDGEGNAHGLAAGLGLDIGSDLLHGGVVALAAGYHGLGDGHDVPVTGLDALLGQGIGHGVGGDGDHVVALAEDGRTHATHYGTKGSAHVIDLLFGGVFFQARGSIPYLAT